METLKTILAVIILIVTAAFATLFLLLLIVNAPEFFIPFGVIALGIGWFMACGWAINQVS